MHLPKDRGRRGIVIGLLTGAVLALFASLFTFAAATALHAPPPHPVQAPGPARLVHKDAIHRPRFAITTAGGVVALLARKGVPCAAPATMDGGAVPGAASTYIDCNGAGPGDTAISVFTSHVSALAYANDMLLANAGTPVAEVVGPDWVVNSVPVYAFAVHKAIRRTEVIYGQPTPLPSNPAAQMPQIVARFHGTGSKVTAPFRTSPSWTLTWSYDCANVGGAGPFTVSEFNSGDNSLDLAGGLAVATNGNGAGPDATDITGDANDGPHYLQVTSPCAWSMTVTSS